MRKKIFIFGLIFLVLSIPQSIYAQVPTWVCGPGARGADDPPPTYTTCGTLTQTQSGTSSNWYIRFIQGIYDTQGEAQAAHALGEGNNITGNIDAFCTTSECGAGLGVYQRRLTTSCGGGKNTHWDQYWIYNRTFNACEVINNQSLPWDSENFLFRLTAVCKDTSGNITAESYEFRNLDTGEQKFSTYGDLSTCDEIEIYANSPWYTSALFESDPSEPFVTGSPSDILGSITQDYAQDIETLTGGDDDGVDDSGLLQNIATNTKINASNQQIISEQLTAQGNYQIKLGNEQKVLLSAIASATGGTGTRLDITNSLLAQIRDGIGEGGGGGGDGPGAVEIGEAVGDELIESTEFTGQTGNEFDGILSELNAFRSELGIPESDDEYFPEGGINDEEDFKKAVQDMLIDKTDTTWFQALRNLMMMDRITAAGSCTASVSMWGGSIDLSVCGLQGALNVFGTVLLGFATITAFMVALRG